MESSYLKDSFKVIEKRAIIKTEEKKSEMKYNEQIHVGKLNNLYFCLIMFWTLNKNR
jgi:hypothetical protein